MKTISLTQGQVALVDDEDFESLRQHNWCAMWSENSRSFYAVRNRSKSEGGGLVLMHREVTKAVHGSIVDHEDHNTLNNQKENLKVGTHASNQKNRTLQKNNVSGINGVSWNAQKGKWQARITVEGKSKHLGFFDDPARAAPIIEAAKQEAGYHKNHGVNNGSV